MTRSIPRVRPARITVSEETGGGLLWRIVCGCGPTAIRATRWESGGLVLDRLLELHGTEVPGCPHVGILRLSLAYDFRKVASR